MKRKLSLAFAGLALLLLGFATGRFYQDFRSGYHYQVRDTKDYDSSMGTVRWSYVTESIGMPFLDSGTTLLEIDEKTIYKAKRGFQESTPFAKNINVSQDRISWDDGDFRFDLVIQRMKNSGPNTASGGDKPPN